MKPRGVLIAGNWKMNHTVSETERFFSELNAAAQRTLPPASYGMLKSGLIKACVIPPMLSLQKSVQLAASAPFPLNVATQNAHWEKSGAFTGEISPLMLKEVGISWSLVAHSERRQFFGETDATAKKRVEGLLSEGFHVIFCIGETRLQREQNKTEEVLKTQLSAIASEKNKGAACFLDGRLIIAYEPVWAIGTGLTATPEQAEDA
ncbi:MAG: triose-phosphate isomerase, partial [Bdellovibrionota bacterium]